MGNYKMAILKQCLLFPQRTGKITINPGKFDFQVETYQLVNGPFGPMRVPQGVSRSVSSNAASVEVMPLPAGKPVSFMGGVGNFKSGFFIYFPAFVMGLEGCYEKKEEK